MGIIKRIKKSICVRSLNFFRKVVNTIRLQKLDKESYLFLQMAVKWDGFNIVPYNFGDDLNVYLFEELTGKKILKYNEYFHITKTNYLGIGSIIEWYSTSQSIVWGSGAMYGDGNKSIKLRSVKALRGVYTKKYLEECGIECPNVFGDPALLLPLVYNPINIGKKYKYGVVPHFVDLNSQSVRAFCQVNEDVLLINLQNYTDWHDIIMQFMSCENIISSSLHGLIIADAYKIPNVRIKLSDNILGGDFKYKDYYSGVGRLYKDGVDCSNQIIVNDINSALSNYQPIDFDYRQLLNTFPFPLASKYKDMLNTKL